MPEALEPKLLAIDGLSIARRVYEAIPAPDSPQKADGAMKSTFASIRRALKEHNPTHVLLAFDYGGPTWRHQIYPLYKATRKSTPQCFTDALPGLYDELQRSLGVKVLSIPGVEADDVVGTGVTVWDAAGRGTAVILTVDKDLYQLVNETVWIWDHFKGFWKDAAWIQEKFGVPPEHLADYHALIGDTTDCIPGVPGVGPKTALKLLSEHDGSLRVLVDNADKIKGLLGEALRAHLKQLCLSRRLVGLKTDVRLGVTWSQLRWAGFPSAAFEPRQSRAAVPA